MRRASSPSFAHRIRSKNERVNTEKADLERAAKPARATARTAARLRAGVTPASARSAARKPHIAAGFHHAWLEAIKKETTSTHILAHVLAKKLVEQGIDGDKHLDALKKVAAGLLSGSANGDEATFHLDLGGADFDGRHISIHLDPSDLDAAAERMGSAIEEASLKVFEDAGERALNNVLRDPDPQLLYLATEHDAFVRRLALKWAKPFKLLDIHVAICHEIGDARNDWLRKTRKRSKDIIVVDVITRLHGRAVQVAREVQVLLRNGFAEGALSRWRTLHELAVVAMFVAQKGADVAERYSAHFDADSVRAGRQYQKFAPALKYAPMPEFEQRRLDRLKLELETKYGKSFFGDYGWAAEALQVARPTFAQIEAAIELDRFRPYVGLASNAVHAGAKGTYFRLGLIGNEDVILTGASNAGLEEAGRLAAHSLAQISATLLMLQTNADSIIWSRVLLALCKKVEHEFVVVKQRIEREERQLRRKGVARHGRS